jgi:serine protease Do
MIAKHLLAILVVAIPLAASGNPNKVEKEDEKGRGHLGVRMQPIEGGLAEALNLEENSGVLLGHVAEEGPAGQAGLEAGDILTAIDGKKIEEPSDVRRVLRDHHAGDAVEVDYLRDGRAAKARVTLGDKEAMDDLFGRRLEKIHELRIDRERGFLGVMTQPLSGDLGEYFGVENGEGALVSEVVDESPAKKLGLRAGDVIVEVAGEKVTDPEDLREIVGDFEEEKEVEVAWIRDGRRQTGKTTLEVREGPVGMWGHEGGPFSFDMEPMRRHVGYLKSDEFRDDLRQSLEDVKKELGEIRAELDRMRAESKSD